MACLECGESRFANEAQALCHGYRNHAPFTCGCEKKFFTEEELEKHEKAQKESAKEHACDKCCRSFKEKEPLNQHKSAKDHWKPGEKEKIQANSGRSYCDCGRSFKTHQGLQDHIKDKPSLVRGNTCLTCTDKFKTTDALKHHQRDTNHGTTFKSSKDARQTYLTNYHERHAAVNRDDMRESVGVVKDKLDKIMHHVNGQDDGNFFSPNYAKAGSYAAKTKIGKADEFDYTVHLNVKGVEARDRGPLHYKFENKNGVTPKHMKGSCKLVDVPNSKEIIKNGYATAAAPKDGVPDKWTHKGNIIPSYVQKDLHQKIEHAINKLGMDKEGVHLLRKAHGPAITLNIKQPGKHDISVDITPSMNSDLPVTANCWPRPDTRKALSDSQIEMVIAAGTHLVPKGDTDFAVSYSKAEKAVLNNIDAGNGCRKMCHQVMKRYVQEFISKSPDGAPGISSHILKHQLFNMNEKHPSPDYWHQRNFGERVPDMMKDFAQVLKTRKLPNYFNTGENILAGKDRNVLNNLCDFFKTKREELLHIR